ncbi:MAG: DNRLRE domain-containing protein [Eubacteriales bacterium]|nr:DNRLRE domain-containing protein [Eubacteriales bacterium]
MRKIKKILSLLIALLLMSGIFSTVAFAQLPEDTIVVSADAGVDGSNEDRAATNYGSTNNMPITSTGSRLSYFKFNLEAIRPRLETYDIESVTMTVHMMGSKADGSATTNDISIHAMHLEDDTWQEGVINYNNRPTAASVASASVLIPAGTSAHTFTLDVTSAVVAELQKTPQDNVFSCYLAGGTGKSQTIILYTRENSANKPITLTVKYKERVPEGLTVLNKAFKVGYTKTISLFTVNDGTLKDVQFEVPVTEAVAHEALKPDDNKISIMVNVKSQTSSAGLSFYKEQGTTNLDYKPQIVVSTQEDTYVIYPEIVARIRGGEYANDLAVDSFEVKEGARIHGGARYVYLKFDISDIKGLEIKNAKLKVTTNKDVNGEFNLALYYIENDDWDMSNLTMNNRPVIGRYENTGSEETMVMQSEVFLKSTYLNSKTFVVAMCVYIEDENNVKMLQNISLYPITLGSNEEQRFVYTEEISKSQQGIVGKLMIFDDIHSSFKPEIEAISSM